jgi:hypothetical protein
MRENGWTIDCAESCFLSPFSPLQPPRKIFKITHHWRCENRLCHTQRRERGTNCRHRIKRVSGFRHSAPTPFYTMYFFSSFLCTEIKRKMPIFFYSRSPTSNAFLLHHISSLNWNRFECNRHNATTNPNSILKATLSTWSPFGCPKTSTAIKINVCEPAFSSWKRPSLCTQLYKNIMMLFVREAKLIQLDTKTRSNKHEKPTALLTSV